MNDPTIALLVAQIALSEAETLRVLDSLKAHGGVDQKSLEIIRQAFVGVYAWLLAQVGKDEL